MKPAPIITFFLLFSLSSITAQSWQVEYLEGEAQIQRNDTVLEADFGTPLAAGDLLTTRKDSLLIISSTRGDTIKMRENSTIRLDSLNKDTRVHLENGGIFSRIVKLLTGSTYNVTTPSIAAGVRGTEFFIAYGRVVETEADVWLCVNEGTVAVEAAEKEVLVNAGEGINILNGSRITDPRYYPWTETLNWNTDPKKGAVNDNTDLSGAYSDLLDIDYD